MHKQPYPIPESMQEELSKWNNGSGIDLEGWLCSSGSYSLAAGYTTLFWPEFIEFEGYLLRKGFSIESLRGFEQVDGTNPKTIEWVMNHMHIAHVHYGSEDMSKDKIILLGNTLKEIYQAKLKWLFPEKPCLVELYIPEQHDDLDDYQISFWQAKHES
ncbi:MAG: hypothetical protein ACMZ63_07605 [Methylotenera sp.]